MSVSKIEMNEELSTFVHAGVLSTVTEMTDAELTSFVRVGILAIAGEGPGKEVLDVANLFRKAGVVKNIHVGTDPNIFTPRMKIEWYAGQLLDIVDQEGWVSMNSFINGLDKFVPRLKQ